MVESQVSKIRDKVEAMRTRFNDEIKCINQVEVVKVQRNNKWREEQVRVVVQRNLIES